MNLIEKFLKEKYPNILEEFNAYKAENEKSKKEKEDKARADYRAKHKFWETEFYYEIDERYKNPCDDCYIPFSYAFNLFSDNELGRKLVILKPTDEDYSKGEGFADIIEYAGIKESELKKEFKDFLYQEDYYCLWSYVDKRMNGKHIESIGWGGTYYWDKSHFNEMWEEFKTLRFIEKELDDDFWV